jgi:hypothetical protein
MFPEAIVGERAGRPIRVCGGKLEEELAAAAAEAGAADAAGAAEAALELAALPGS